MSIQAPRLTTPTIILVGGRMTVDDGSTLDSRQPIRGDPWSVVTNNSLATSLLWWTTIASLVDRLLEAASQSDPFALVIGSRSIVEVRPDKVIVMADLAEHSDEIDEAKAIEARKKAEAELDEVHDPMDMTRVRAALQTALMRERIATRRRSRG